MRVALDTNVLVYAEGLGDDVRCQLAGNLIARLKPTDSIVAVQVLGELSPLSIHLKPKPSPTSFWLRPCN